MKENLINRVRSIHEFRVALNRLLYAYINDYEYWSKKAKAFYPLVTDISVSSLLNRIKSMTESVEKLRWRFKGKNIHLCIEKFVKLEQDLKTEKEIACYISAGYYLLDFLIKRISKEANLESNTIKPLKAFHELEYTSHPEAKFLMPVVRLVRDVKNFLSNYLAEFFIIGSISTMDFVPGFSDLDTVMIVKEDVLLKPSCLMSFRQKNLALLKYFGMLDVFQHHASFMISEIDLSFYDESIFPYELFRMATGCIGQRYAPVFTSIRGLDLCRELAVKFLRSLWNDYKSGLPTDPYNLVFLIHKILMVPVYVSAGLGFPKYKRDSFWISKFYSSNEWRIVDIASKTRCHGYQVHTWIKAFNSILARLPNPFLRYYFVTRVLRNYSLASFFFLSHSDSVNSLKALVRRSLLLLEKYDIKMEGSSSFYVDSRISSIGSARR